jgi:hypothetical protein
MCGSRSAIRARPRRPQPRTDRNSRSHERTRSRPHPSPSPDRVCCGRPPPRPAAFFCMAATGRPSGALVTRWGGERERMDGTSGHSSFLFLTLITGWCGERTCEVAHSPLTCKYLSACVTSRGRAERVRGNQLSREPRDLPPRPNQRG